jgi:putative NADH-flavin reductase
VRVAIFGATGGVGRWLVSISRENEDHVKLLARDPSALPKDLGAIGVIRGDVLDLEAVDATVGGCDVVFSALGSRGLGATTLYSRGMANIITAMKANSVTRLLAITSAGVEDDPNMNFFARRFVMPVILRNVLADMRVMESEIEASGLVWTIVRPGRLTDGPRTGLYRANDRFVPEGGREISRADVADFMHRVVADERTIRKIAALTY